MLEGRSYLSASPYLRRLRDSKGRHAMYNLSCTISTT